MTPHKPVSPRQLRQVLKSLHQSPLEESEIAEISDPTNPDEDPSLALAIETNGIPMWWPRKHPETLEKLKAPDRSRWFLEYLAGELSPEKETLRSGDERSKRLTTARSLLRIQSRWNPAEIPIPD